MVKPIYLTFTILLAVASKVFSFTCKKQDQKGCKCINRANVTAFCRIDHLTDLKRYITFPSKIKKLDLSKSKIQEVPPKSLSEFTGLSTLSLSASNIQTIKEHAFFGLKNLNTLSLRGNNIKHWNTRSLINDLPRLEVLNIEKNIDYMPDKNILGLPYLSRIHFLDETFLARYKIRCVLSKNVTKYLMNRWILIPHSLKNVDILTKLHDGCVESNLVINQKMFWNKTSRYGFQIICKSINARSMSISNTKSGWYHIEAHNNKCWNTVNLVYILTALLGIVSFVLNLIVIATTLKSDALRESTAHVLVANLASGDFLTSVYTITLTVTRQIVSFETFFLFHRHFCRFVGIIFMIGQFISPLMTLMMTLERYFVIVHCMNAGRRITLKHAYIAMVVGWTSAITLSMCIMLAEKMTSATTDDVCIALSNAIGQLNVLFYPAVLLSLCYLTSVILYLHIYFDIKKTGQRTVQSHKDSSIAKKIALIIATNILFYILPLLVIGAITYSFFGNYLDLTTKRIFWECFGITCFVANSCLNPMLFSFRNTLFRTELCKQIGWNSNKVHVDSCKGGET